MSLLAHTFGCVEANEANDFRRHLPFFDYFFVTCTLIWGIAMK